MSAQDCAAMTAFFLSHAPSWASPRQRGAAALEFALVMTVLLPAALLAIEAASWQTVRQAAHLALMEAARAGSVSHAHPARMKTAFLDALLPLHGAGAQARPRQARSLQDVARLTNTHPWRIEILQPDALAFQHYGKPALRVEGAAGLPAIDNDYQDLQHARRSPGAAIDIFQANTLKLRLTYLHKPWSGFSSTMLALATRAAASPGSTDYAKHAQARGLVPIRVELEMEMHSHPVDWSRARPPVDGEGMVYGACRELRCG